VQQNIYFPSDWKQRWPEAHEHITDYTKEGKHSHDDAEDMLTGIAEDFKNSISVLK
jgi:hypothetical protein